MLEVSADILSKPLYEKWSGMIVSKDTAILKNNSKRLYRFFYLDPAEKFA